MFGLLHPKTETQWMFIKTQCHAVIPDAYYVRCHDKGVGSGHTTDSAAPSF